MDKTKKPKPKKSRIIEIILCTYIILVLVIVRLNYLILDWTLKENAHSETLYQLNNIEHFDYAWKGTYKIKCIGVEEFQMELDSMDIRYAYYNDPKILKTLDGTVCFCDIPSNWINLGLETELRSLGCSYLYPKCLVIYTGEEIQMENELNNKYVDVFIRR